MTQDIIKHTGLLVHGRHLDTTKWEETVWGLPKENRLGSLPMLVTFMLDEPADEPIGPILFITNPSKKDGKIECDYTKSFLLQNFERLTEFPRLQTHPKFQSETDRQRIYNRLTEIIAKPLASNTYDEIVLAAKLFRDSGVHKVMQLTSASHAPRCIREQSRAKAEGFIDRTETWSVIADDMCYYGSTPSDTIILEPPHRADNQAGAHRSMPPEMLMAFYRLNGEHKDELLETMEALLRKYPEAKLRLEPVLK